MLGLECRRALFLKDLRTFLIHSTAWGRIAMIKRAEITAKTISAIYLILILPVNKKPRSAFSQDRGFIIC